MRERTQKEARGEIVCHSKNRRGGRLPVDQEADSQGRNVLHWGTKKKGEHKRNDVMKSHTARCYEKVMDGGRQELLISGVRGFSTQNLLGEKKKSKERGDLQKRSGAKKRLKRVSSTDTKHLIVTEDSVTVGNREPGWRGEGKIVVEKLHQWEDANKFWGGIEENLLTRGSSSGESTFHRKERSKTHEGEKIVSQKAMEGLRRKWKWGGVILRFGPHRGFQGRYVGGYYLKGTSSSKLFENATLPKT